MQIETSRARSGRYVYLVCHFWKFLLEMTSQVGRKMRGTRILIAA